MLVWTIKLKIKTKAFNCTNLLLESNKIHVCGYLEGYNAGSDIHWEVDVMEVCNLSANLKCNELSKRDVYQ